MIIKNHIKIFIFSYHFYILQPLPKQLASFSATTVINKPGLDVI